MQKSMAATKDSYFGKIGDAQGFMSDTCTGLFTSQQTNKTVPEMADTANLMPPSHDKDGGGGGSRNNQQGEILDLTIFLKNPRKSV